MGQFKDGLDMSAIREVKTLQELRHPNVVGVSTSFFFLLRGRAQEGDAGSNQPTALTTTGMFNHECNS